MPHLMRTKLQLHTEEMEKFARHSRRQRHARWQVKVNIQDMRNLRMLGKSKRLAVWMGVGMRDRLVFD